MMRCTTIRWRIAAAAAALAILLGGCGRLSFGSGTKSEKEYGLAETMVIVTSERVRYEELYSEKIWNAAVDNRGTTFESTLILQIHEFLKELKVMSLMAKEKDIQLNSLEKEQTKLAAEQYFALFPKDKAVQYGLEEKKVRELYTDYWLSEKLVEQLTDGANLEVSDSEAKVITVAQLSFDDQETAAAALARIREGEDFTTIAKEYSQDKENRRQIFRDLRGSEYEEAAYALTTGEVSDVISEDGRFYLIKCISDYDETATKIHKEQMMREKKNDAFYLSYQAFKEEIKLTGDDEMWKTISISGSPKVDADFFGIFEEICTGKQGA